MGKKNVKIGAASLKGMDVSHYQGAIDFKKVKAEGNSFVICKASDGDLGKESTYKTHSSDARANGLVVGAYHYFRFKKDPIKQMDNLISVIGAHRVGDLPPVIDVEWSEGVEVVGGYDDEVLAALAYLEQKLGVVPIVYTSAAFFTNPVNKTAWKKYPLWIASYRKDYAIIPDFWDTFHFWQQTDKNTSQGIQGNVDGDLFNGTMAQLMMLTGMTTAKTPPITDPKVSPLMPIAPAPVTGPTIIDKIVDFFKSLFKGKQ